MSFPFSLIASQISSFLTVTVYSDILRELLFDAWYACIRGSISFFSALTLLLLIVATMSQQNEVYLLLRFTFSNCHWGVRTIVLHWRYGFFQYQYQRILKMLLKKGDFDRSAIVLRCSWLTKLSSRTNLHFLRLPLMWFRSLNTNIFYIHSAGPCRFIYFGNHQFCRNEVTGQ